MPGRTHARDLAGRRFGRLRVLGESDDRASNGQILWQCECKCGKIKLVMTTNLTAADGTGSETRSCGCLKGFKGGRSARSRTAARVVSRP
jgi:hypothetical protein